MAEPGTDISDFKREDLSFDRVSKPVLKIGETGPAVIVIHEVFGFSPTLARFCRWLAEAGFRVYAPILLGTPDALNKQDMTLGRLVELCVSREFTLFARGRSSPVVDWLIPLARHAHQESGGKGVGVIGMCLTGGFALSMAVDPVVLAPVMSQPSMPPRDPAGLDIDAARLVVVKRRCADEGLCVRGYRFDGDVLSRAPKFETLKRELGDAFIGVTFPDEAGNLNGMKARGRPPHSVFTADLIDEPGQPTRLAVDEVIGFFRERLVG